MTKEEVVEMMTKCIEDASIQTAKDRNLSVNDAKKWLDDNRSQTVYLNSILYDFLKENDIIKS